MIDFFWVRQLSHCAQQGNRPIRKRLEHGGHEFRAESPLDSPAQSEDRESGFGLLGHSCVIPGYEFVREIGPGGQATVYQGRCTKTNEDVAIKIIEWGRYASRDIRTRFEREARLLAQLDHPSIVRFRDKGTLQNSHAYLVMDLIDGLPLNRALLGEPVRNQLRANPWEFLALFRTICDALGSAHEQDIVHRDVSPQNILLDVELRPYVIDFGLARTPLETFLDSSQRSVTVTGQFLGRRKYASPEQFRGDSEKVGIRSDVFSLGVVFFEIVTGGALPYPPLEHVIGFSHDAGPSSLSSVAKSRRRLSKRREWEWIDDLACHHEIERIVTKALHVDPMNRHASASDLANDFERLIAQGNVRQSMSRRRFYISVLAGVAVVGVAAMSKIILGSNSGERSILEKPKEMKLVLPPCKPMLHRILEGGPDSMGRLVIHPRNTVLRAATREDNGIVAWNLATGESLGSASGTLFDVYSPTGDVVYSSGRLVHTEFGLSAALEGTLGGEKGVFSLDGERIATMREWTSTVRVFRTHDGERLLEKEFPYDKIAQFDISPDGRRLAAAGGSPTAGVTLWDVDSQQEIGPLLWHGGEKTFVRFSLDGSRLCTFHVGGLLGVYDANTGQNLSTSRIRAGKTSKRSRLHVVPNTFIVLWEDTEKNELVLWDVLEDSARSRLALDAPLSILSAVAPDGSLVLTVDDFHGLRMWDSWTGTVLFAFDFPASQIRSLAFSPDGSLIASGENGGIVRVWHTTFSE